MGEKIEAIEVKILSDDDVGKEKSTNRIDHALNRLTDDSPTSDGQLSDKDQSLNSTTDEHENWGFYEQVKSLFFPVSSKKAISINSIKANLNQVPDDNRIRCNKKLVEIIPLGVAILTVIAVFMVPVILYHTRPPIPATDDSVTNFFKTCVCY